MPIDYKKLFSKPLILFLGEFLGFFFFYYFITGSFLGFPFSLIVSILEAFFMSTSVWFFILVFSEFKSYKLIKASPSQKSSASFIDGKQIAVFGKIQTVSGVQVVSPVTKTGSVFYKYEIYHWESQKTSGGRFDKRKVLDYSGTYLAAPIIKNDTLGINVKILSIPYFKGFRVNHFDYSPETSLLYTNVKSYMHATAFEMFDTNFQNIGKVLGAVKDILSESDGVFKKDYKSSTAITDLTTLVMEEQVVSFNADVCAIGMWSSDKQGLVTDLNKDRNVYLYEGTYEKVLSVSKRIIIRNIVIGLVSFVLINAVVFSFWYGYLHGGIAITETINGRIIKRYIIDGKSQPESTETSIAEESTQSTQSTSSFSFNPNETSVFEKITKGISESSQSTKSVIVTGSTPAKEIAWSSYTNDFYAYKYDYPDNWHLKEDTTYDTDGETVLAVDTSLAKISGKLLKGGFWITKVYGSDYCKSREIAIEVKGMKKTIQEVAGYSATVLEGANTPAYIEPHYRKVALIVTKNITGNLFCYEINLLDEKGNPNKSVFDKILSSLAINLF